MTKKQRKEIDECILRFSLKMKTKLLKNTHKGTWKECTWGWLMKRLYGELWELENSITSGKSEEEVELEAADVANFAMFIADIYEKNSV